MSVQFGRWHFEGAPPPPKYLEKVQTIMSTHGIDGVSAHSGTGVNILHCALCTSKESRSEIQPHTTPTGSVFAWDGRLDNRLAFIALLAGSLSIASPDVSVVAAAYQRWGTDCFARLIGDWALSIWDPNDRSLILAKDAVGTRPLYYSADRDQVTWSSLLDPLVLCSDKTLELDEEYVAGYFSFFPAAHLTPYVGIRSVAPSFFVRFQPRKETTHKYWDFDPEKRIRYDADAEYEEHFRTVFRESVHRRLRSDLPVLAELSGGLDSSSIVCVADAIIARGHAETPRLDTLSYFDDSEPNWNERPYFSKVEQMRGRSGCHIDLGSDHGFSFEIDTAIFQAIPGARTKTGQSVQQHAAFLREGPYRVVLSGIGGDEVTGGAPTPLPELADLLGRGRFRMLAHQLKAWSLVQGKPWFQLFWSAASRFLPTTSAGVSGRRQPPPWLDSNFIGRHRTALAGYESRLRLFGPLPSFQENMSTLDALRRQLACGALPADPPYEKRYPYLDRDFLEFVFAIPREQLVRPGERRSLMRRALAGLVPSEILNRRRKAYVVRAPLASISAKWQSFAELRTNMISGSLGILSARAFEGALQSARQGREVPIVTLMRTIELEMWLRTFGQMVSNNRIGDGPINLSRDEKQAKFTPRSMSHIDLSAESISTKKGVIHREIRKA